MTRQIPLILKTDVGGLPIKWISWQEAVASYARDIVQWSTGAQKFEIKAGWSNQGQRTIVMLDSIIAVGDKSHKINNKMNGVPHLSNKTLFQRDHYICMYCGHKFSRAFLTRDHIHPLSKGGVNTWENCVTACKSCNSKKDDKTLDQVNMKLLAVPYVPNLAEWLILSNRNILMDQMEFLEPFTTKNSRKQATMVE